ncbi:regulator of (H+)-ATPase in vacuolar membrane [Coemansia sp. RSA 1878]|nr:regulator of (H+)-ATPase in vacuolar membrane [Coemansia sp. RSA 1878]
MRFHYVMHSDSVGNMFWHQSNEQPAGSQDLVLYTVTRGGRLSVWHSTADSDPARSSETCSGIRFALSGTLDIAKDTCSSIKEFIAIGVSCPPLTVKPKSAVSIASNIDSRHSSGSSVINHESDAADKGDTPSSQPDTPPNPALTAADGISTHSELHEAHVATSSEATSSKGSTQPAITAATVERVAIPIDRVYAVFSDGSLDMWEIKLPNRFSSLTKARAVLCTHATDTQLLCPPSSNATVSLAQSLLWPDGLDTFTLAITDPVGHVFVLNTPQVSDDVTMAPSLRLRNLWDGHKRAIFHISVDPYSQRIATHSTEGELLIWETIDAEHISLPISRKVALDESQIHTIAWAPAEHEFIAATDKRVYRLTYDSSAEQWHPSDFSLPQMGPYDRIFTYPAANSGEEAGVNPSTDAYYVSTVAQATRSVQTWFVAGPNERIEYIGKSELKQVQRFDRASRVMPVAHPFFSRDNIMATFDSNAGKLHIWGIRTVPKFMWFCAKEHRLPCLNVDMIRYNSIDKAAIVSTDEKGLQTVTIWVFSSASRRSHYLPAGTIYPKRKSDRVQEVRWHLTEYAQTYLGIQWDDRIDIYCQERNIDSGWLCAYTISAAQFGPGKSIGSFSFTAAGEPTFAIDKQLFVYSQELEEGKTISDVAYEEHGELPLVHPFILTELMSWGKIEAVKRLLSLLYEYFRELSIDSKRNAALPLIPLQDLLSLDTTSKYSQSASQPPATSSMFSKYASLLGSSLGDDVLTMDSATPDFEQFTQEKADFVAEKLTEIKIKGLSPIDQTRLLSIVGTISASQIKDQSIDSMGVRYLVKLQLLELENKRTRTAAELPYRELNWALHSNSQAILLQICLQRHASNGLTWESARQMGLCVWLSNNDALQLEVEKMARNIFIAEGRDPTKCAIFYLALKKQRLLLGLWRTAHTHPDHSKMVAFLANDFNQTRWKTAAAKNAYVLLSRQRYLDAATFFLLSGKLSDAVRVCVTQLKDFQLAIAICRCYEGDSGPVLKDVMWKHILPDAFKRQDRWLASLAFGIIHRYDLVLQSLTDDLSKLGSQIGVEAEISSYSTMNVLDTELLILYRSMLDYSSSYRAPLVTQAELIAQTMTIFECLGAPIMSLVVLEWWRKELLEITKRSATSVSMASTGDLGARSGRDNASNFESGVPDMSVFAGFAGFGGSGANTQKPTVVDPIETGLLSMDSFGSMFSTMSTSGNASSHANEALPKLSSANETLHQRDIDHTSTSESSTQDVENESLLAVDIEDTPVQYACRVTLALQIIEFVSRSKADSDSHKDIDIDEAKQTVANILRLPISVFVAS